MIGICFNVLFFKERRSRKDNLRRSSIDLKKNKIGKVGKFLKQCTGFEREGKGRKLGGRT